MERKAIYAGSFDPPTIGHLNVIDRAAKMFDKVYVVIGDNSQKKTYLDLTTRKFMLMGMLDFLDGKPRHSNVKIKIASNQYIAHVAKRLGANFLVRGLRDTIDYSYEHNVFQVNKRLAPSVETVYLMCDSSDQLVSSSIVKAMIGFIGWSKAITDKLHPAVLEDLKVWWLRKRLKDLHERGRCSLGHYENTWEVINENYRNRAYHNFDHLIECFAWLDKMAISLKPYKKDPIEYALWFHDVKDDVNESAKLAISLLSWGSTKNDTKGIGELIQSTNHSQEVHGRGFMVEYGFIASVDLAILGSLPDDYLEYTANVREECLQKGCSPEEWIKGRLEFIDDFLAREHIYPNEEMRRELENQARSNLEEEYVRLTNKRNGDH